MSDEWVVLDALDNEADSVVTSNADLTFVKLPNIDDNDYVVVGRRPSPHGPAEDAFRSAAFAPAEAAADRSITRVLHRKQRKGVLYYLVQYFGDPEPVWEEADTLVEAGHLPKLLAYDRGVLGASAVMAKSCKKKRK